MNCDDNSNVSGPSGRGEADRHPSPADWSSSPGLPETTALASLYGEVEAAYLDSQFSQLTTDPEDVNYQLGSTVTNSSLTSDAKPGPRRWSYFPQFIIFFFDLSQVPFPRGPSPAMN
jgi:hypothetical protein